MNEHLNHAPCGFVTLSKNGNLLSCNQTMSQLLGYDTSQLVGQHINFILSESAKIFIQLYFFPLVTVQHRVEEMYLSLVNKHGEEISILMNASLTQDTDNPLIRCVIIPMKKRDEYENQLLMAKKVAEDALQKKNKAYAYLEGTLNTLKSNQQKLLSVNIENQKFKTEIQSELNLAKKIQETALTETISNEFIEIKSHYHASRELSGDNYGFYQINDHQYGVILLDVMGNGISSALISMSLQSLFQRLITRGNDADIVMKELDNYLHSLFHNDQDSWHYCTAIYIIIDTDKQTVECANAGHPPAILQNASGEQLEFNAMSPPIGALEGITFKTETFKYNKDSRILLYTDGVSEPLGEKYLRHLLMQGSSASGMQMKENILKSLRIVDMQEKDKSKDDDQCFILIDLK